MTGKAPNLDDPATGRWKAAARTIRQQLFAERLPSGHWEGELSASALATATAISTFSFYLDATEKPDQSAEVDGVRSQIHAGINWLLTQQNEDGGWGDTPRNYSNISTTMLVVAAFHAAPVANRLSAEILAAESYIEKQGGIAGLRRRYGKDKTFAVPILANCAMAGIVPWSEVSALPFEAACVPQRFYNWLQLPVVSYAIPALVAIGQAKFHFDPPWDPVRRTIRRFSIKPGLNVLQKMQPASGGYLEAIPLTSFVCMALCKTGNADHPVVQNGIRFLVESFRNESSQGPHPSPLPEGEGALRVSESDGESGSWPIDTNLATWNTTLTINALANNPTSFRRQLNEKAETWQSCLDWLLECQNTETHPFTGAAPGGWGWSDLSGAVPDADDTPGALLAILKIVDSDCDWLDETHRQRIATAANLGVRWLLGLQNRDGGWPTFCKGWGKLPFDRSGPDITAHVIRGLLAWKDHGDDKRSQKISKAIAKGFRYLEQQQRPDGSWLPLWFGNQDQPDEENPFYGTSRVLLAYRDAGMLETRCATDGFNWLGKHQRDEGSWGGGCWIDSPTDLTGNWDPDQLGHGSVEETAICVEALLSSPNVAHQTMSTAGLNWLALVVEREQNAVCSPIGFYFAKLWYFEALYPLTFASSVFERALRSAAPSVDNEIS